MPVPCNIVYICWYNICPILKLIEFTIFRVVCNIVLNGINAVKSKAKHDVDLYYYNPALYDNTCLQMVQSL